MKITVEIADRVDKALARHFPDAGRRQLSQLFDEGLVRVAGKLAKKGDRVAIGDVIELSREPVSGDALRVTPDPAAAAGLVILLERADVVVIAKPSGMPSQPLRAGELGTAANALVARYPECVEIGDDPRDGGLVHRLDIGTSGVLVGARTPEAYRAMRDALGAGIVDKQYLAIACERPVSRECDAPLVQRGKRVAVDHTDGLAAYTSFEVERESKTHALVRCSAATGRMHQVRAHLANVGSPIAGDELYGGAPVPGLDGFFLHAARIVLPLGADKVTVEAPPPDKFQRALEICGLS
ncbi:MAG: RluA family pseudouridine synthase [Deltaproteobacteria bacterium]|nr:RluA family pseudouridine synthase [Deltaproteobacteria bacterium]